jgi:predicted nucleic acid-binding protein
MRRTEYPGGLPRAVIDTTLLSRLVHLDIAALLPLIFKIILIPPEVRREAYKSPGKGKRRLQKLVREMSGFFVDCTEADQLIKDYLMADLHAGEAAAIAQADYTKSVLLIDEKKGHRRATNMDITVFRTTTLLCMLKEAGAIKAVGTYLDKLEVTGFYLSREDRTRILREAGEGINS